VNDDVGGGMPMTANPGPAQLRAEWAGPGTEDAHDDVLSDAIGHVAAPRRDVLIRASVPDAANWGRQSATPQAGRVPKPTERPPRRGPRFQTQPVQRSHWRPSMDPRE